MKKAPLPALLPSGPVSDDKITFMLVGLECGKYFEMLAEHRPSLADTRLDKSCMQYAISKPQGK